MRMAIIPFVHSKEKLLGAYWLLNTKIEYDETSPRRVACLTAGRLCLLSNFKQMKLQFIFLQIIILLVLGACSKGNSEMGDFKLLPQPQEFNIYGVSKLAPDQLKSYFSDKDMELYYYGKSIQNLKKVSTKSKAQIILSIDSMLHPKAEGYTLEILEEQISMVGKDKAGLIYALMTLEQLMIDAAEQKVNLPLCSISDYPELAYRTIHLDLKHHRETLEYYYQLMDQLASYKINAIIVEVEDQLAYERQPLIGSANALSISDWKALSEYAMERNIEISPLIQGLGHASFVLKHEEYKYLRDDPESDWAFNPLDPKTYEVQFDLYLDAFEAFPYGRYLHVGGDEVHTTGRNSGKTELELQLTWLNKVTAFAAEHGRTPIFWDDMPIKYADLWQSTFDLKATPEEAAELWESKTPKLEKYLDMFPKNCVYMRWNYRSPGAAGNLQAMEWFIENGFQVMGATAGQTRWVLMPLKESNMANIKDFAEASIEKDLNGLFLTLWEDFSPHFELYMRGILAFSEYAWSGTNRSTEELKAVFRQREYSHKAYGAEYAFIDSLEVMAAWWTNSLIPGEERNTLLKNDDPSSVVIGIPDMDISGKWSASHKELLEMAALVAERSKEILLIIEKTKAIANRNKYRLEVYSQNSRLINFTAEALLTLKEYDVAEESVEKEKALERVKALPDKFIEVREELEKVYGEIRILNKPEGYILDQDHHTHIANQTINMDWLFMPEILLMKKIEEQYQ